MGVSIFVCSRLSKIKGLSPWWTLAGLAHFPGILAAYFHRWAPQDAPPLDRRRSILWTDPTLFAIITRPFIFFFHCFAVVGPSLFLIGLVAFLANYPVTLQVDGKEQHGRLAWLAVMVVGAFFASVGLGYVTEARTIKAIESALLRKPLNTKTDG